MYARDDEQNLAKYRKSALRFTNRIRKALGQPELEALLPGSIAVAEACVVSKSIEAPGLYGSTSYKKVQVFDAPVSEDTYCGLYEKGHNGYSEVLYLAEGHDADNPNHTHLKPVLTFKVPELTVKFLEMFDNGYYPDLNANSAFEEV